MELSGQCQQAGCTQPRGRLSVFCDAHHEEQLKRAGLWIERRPHHPASELVRHCERVVRRRREGRLERDECAVQIFDLFVTAAGRDSPDHWAAAIEALPVDVLGDVLAFAKSLSSPRAPSWGFPRTVTQAERERAGGAIQANLIERLDVHLRGPR